MPLALVGLPLPCKGPVLGAIPQLVLLDKVNPKNEWFIQVWDDIELVFQKFGADPNSELLPASYWQRLASSRLKFRCRIPF